jgi:hypothetical protein
MVDVRPILVLRFLSMVYHVTSHSIEFSLCLCSPSLWILAILLDLMAHLNLPCTHYTFLSYDVCRLLLHSLHIYWWRDIKTVG